MPDRHLRPQAGDGDTGRVSTDLDRVVAVAAVHDHTVDRRVTRRPAEAAGEVDVDAADVGSAQVVDRDQVDAAEGVEVDPLDAGGIHRHVADVAEQPQAVAVGREGELLGRGCAVEAHRVGAVLALDHVAAVARIPDEQVVTRAQLSDVVAFVAVDRVVAGAAEQGLRSGASEQSVVSVIAGDPRPDPVGEDAVALVDAHSVSAGPGVDGDLRDLLALEAEVGRAVVTDVDLQDASLAGL
jgi:hypothetical protein